MGERRKTSLMICELLITTSKIKGLKGHGHGLASNRDTLSKQ